MLFAIVKVQVPLSGPDTTLLIYAEGKKHMKMQPLTPEIEIALAGDVKGYFNGSLNAAGEWRIGSRVADQDW